MADTWEAFRDRHVAHARGSIGFDERSLTLTLWDRWRAREAARITREALAVACPRGVESTAERSARAQVEGEVREHMRAGTYVCTRGSR